jgi:hypothetical protein
MTDEARRSRSTYLLPPLAFLVVALSGPAYYLYATSQPVIGANIGAGLAIMWTAACGLPWSLWPWFARMPGNDATEAIYTACALLNVALLALFMWWRRSRNQDSV